MSHQRRLHIAWMTIGLLLGATRTASATECRPPKVFVITSAVVVQVYSPDLRAFEGAEVALWWRGGRPGEPAAARGTTDAQGYFRVVGVAPGDYEVLVSKAGYHSPQIAVRVERRNAAPERMVAARLGMGMTSDCGGVCTLAASSSPLDAPPKCLGRPPKGRKR